MSSESDNTERQARINALVDLVKVDAGENFDGLYEVIERMAQGNPRFTKAERVMFQRFLSIVAEHISVQTRVMSDLQGLWNEQKELVRALHENIDLLKRRYE